MVEGHVVEGGEGQERWRDWCGGGGGAGEVGTHQYIGSASGLFTQERRDQNKPWLYICQRRVGVG